MLSAIRIGIVGYGNLGQGVERALELHSDMELVGVFSRREPGQLSTVFEKTQVYPMDELSQFRARIDVLILCGSSKGDLPEQAPRLAALFNTVDSFDTHAKIPEYFNAVDSAAKPAGKTAIISVGWDPGLFSIQRLIGESILPDGATYTFWGRGLSQGHSAAVRRVTGVQDAVQYTIPSEAAMQRVRAGEQPVLTTREKHRRECFVVLEDGEDAKVVEQAIVTMPDYFADYDTSVVFITQEVLDRDHSAMPHGGFVIRSAKTSEDAQSVVEFGLQLGSNAEFTAAVLVAYARAAYRMNQRGFVGAQSVLDVAPGLLSAKSEADLRRELL